MSKIAIRTTALEDRRTTVSLPDKQLHWFLAELRELSEQYGCSLADVDYRSVSPHLEVTFGLRSISSAEKYADFMRRVLYRIYCVRLFA